MLKNIVDPVLEGLTTPSVDGRGSIIGVRSTGKQEVPLFFPHMTRALLASGQLTSGSVAPVAWCDPDLTPQQLQDKAQQAGFHAATLDKAGADTQVATWDGSAFPPDVEASPLFDVVIIGCAYYNWVGRASRVARVVIPLAGNEQFLRDQTDNIHTSPLRHLFEAPREPGAGEINMATLLDPEAYSKLCGMDDLAA